jgi:hypothetical protein
MFLSNQNLISFFWGVLVSLQSSDVNLGSVRIAEMENIEIGKGMQVQNKGVPKTQKLQQ